MSKKLFLLTCNIVIGIFLLTSVLFAQSATKVNGGKKTTNIDQQIQLVKTNTAPTPKWRRSAKAFDFDGDGIADPAFFRPTTDAIWNIHTSSILDDFKMQFGNGTDYLMPADFDGDGKTDVAVWRENVKGNLAYCYILNSGDSTVREEQFGLTGDVMLAGDVDGDGQADPIVFRDWGWGKDAYFMYKGSLNNPNGEISYFHWGVTGDKPVLGDFDGDGKLDAVIFRPSDNTWYIHRSSDGQVQYERWGLSTDKFVPADYDGDGITDLAVFRDGVWYIRPSNGKDAIYEYFGLATDLPVPADYDGDGKANVAVFRDGTWYILGRRDPASPIDTDPVVTVLEFGQRGDKPAQAAYMAE